MAQRIRGHLSFANVTSLLALVFAMGGTSYALTLPKNSVGSKQIRKNAVTTAKVEEPHAARERLRARPAPVRRAPELRAPPDRPVPPDPPAPGARRACRGSPASWAR